MLSHHAVALLGTITLVASSLVGHILHRSDLPVDSFKMKQKIRQVDGSSPGYDIQSWNRGQDPKMEIGESPTHSPDTTNYLETGHETCTSCCNGEAGDCHENCSCWKPLQNESPSTWELAANPPGLWNHHCSPTLQASADNGACPYPCKNKECPCFEFCKSRVCYLIAWRYNPKIYSCDNIGFMCNSYCLFHCDEIKAHINRNSGVLQHLSCSDLGPIHKGEALLDGFKALDGVDDELTTISLVPVRDSSVFSSASVDDSRNALKNDLDSKSIDDLGLSKRILRSDMLI